MARTLTKKQKGFVKDYVETGNGTLAVKQNYAPTTDETARVIAHENLTKPNIVKAIEEALGDELLATKHLELLNAVVFDRISFKLDDSDELIRDIISQMPGYEVIYIRQDDNGKMAYVKAPDSNTQDKALDKAYKIKGTYAPEKKLNLNLDVNEEHRERAINAIRNIRR
jgi:phage terminase small subunit